MSNDFSEILDKFITKNDSGRENCIGVCAFGSGLKSNSQLNNLINLKSSCYGGLQALIRRKAPYVMWTNCMIHRLALASKSMSSDLNLLLELMLEVGRWNLHNTRNLAWTRKLKTRASYRYFTKLNFSLQLVDLSAIFDKLNVCGFRRKPQLWMRKINQNAGQDCIPELQKYASSNRRPFETHLMVCKILCRRKCRQMFVDPRSVPSSSFTRVLFTRKESHWTLLGQEN